MTPGAEATAARQARAPSWVVVVLGILLGAILVLGLATLYLVAEVNDRSEEAAQTKKTVTATKALLDLVAARQLKSQDIPANVERAAEETKRLLAETQAAIDATNEAVAATNQTLDQTNALIAQAQAAAGSAQQSVARLQSRVEGLQRSQKQLGTTLEAELAKVQRRLTSIDDRLEALSSR